MGLGTFRSASGSKRMALGITLTALFLCWYYILVWDPIHSHTLSIKEDLEHLRQEIKRYKAQETKQKRMYAKVKELESHYLLGVSIQQQEFHDGGIRRRIANLTTRHQLKLTRWQPELRTQGAIDGINQTSFHIQVEGGYHQVAIFFSGILSFPEVSSISKFSMVPIADKFSLDKVRTDFRLTKVNQVPLAEVPPYPKPFPSPFGFEENS